MTDWNFDMDAAPTGKVGWKTGVNKHGEEIRWREHVSERIWAASRSGQVIMSMWLPDADRWEGFSASSPPIAWQPFVVPKHPAAERVSS